VIKFSKFYFIKQLKKYKASNIHVGTVPYWRRAYKIKIWLSSKG